MLVARRAAACVACMLAACVAVAFLAGNPVSSKTALSDVSFSSWFINMRVAIASDSPERRDKEERVREVSDLSALMHHVCAGKHV